MSKLSSKKNILHHPVRTGVASKSSPFCPDLTTKVQGSNHKGPGFRPQRSRVPTTKVQGSGQKGPGFRPQRSRAPTAKVQGSDHKGPGFRTQRSRVSDSKLRGSGHESRRFGGDLKHPHSPPPPFLNPLDLCLAVPPDYPSSLPGQALIRAQRVEAHNYLN